MRYIGEEAFASPVTRAEFKRAVHLMADDTDDDDLIDALILAATEVVETATRRPMLARRYEFTIPAHGWRRWWFPVAPVTQVVGYAWRRGAEWQELDPALVHIEQAHDEPQLVVPAGYAAPAGVSEIRVQAVAGYAAGQVLGPLKQAVILVVKDWLEAGIALDQTEYLRVSFGCKLLMRQYRYARPLETAAL